MFREHPAPLPGQACRPIAATCWSSTASARWPARWSGWGASAPGSGCSSCTGPSDEDVLFLQAKEAEASVLERFTKKSQYGNHGARVVAGPAPHAGQQRHLPRLAARRRCRRRQPRLLRPPAAGLEGVDRHRDHGARGPGGVREAVRPHAGPGPCPLRRPLRHGGVPRQQRPRSRRRWPSSPSPTPTRTSGTTRPSPRPARAGGSTPKRGSVGVGDHRLGLAAAPGSASRPA